jgi:hypothetical protein
VSPTNHSFVRGQILCLYTVFTLRLECLYMATTPVTNFRFDPDVLAKLDADRGQMSRSQWVRTLILEYGTHNRDPYRPATSTGVVGMAPRQTDLFAPRPRRLAPTEPHGVTSVPPARRPAPRSPKTPPADRCPHPEARVSKGQCQACGEFVG